MKQDLSTQLSEYGTYCEERQGSVVTDDVIETIVTLPMRPHPTRRTRGWLVAAGTAATILILIGGTALLSGRSDEPVSPAEPTPPTVLSMNSTVATLPTEGTQDDPEVGTVTDTLPIGVDRPSEQTVVLDGAIWIAAGRVTRIDTRDLTTETVDVGLEANGALEADGALWVWSTEGSVSRIDPASRQVTDSIPISDDIRQAYVVESDNAIWVKSSVGSGNMMLSRIDLATRQVTDQHSLSPWFLWLVATEDALWGYDPGGMMHRFDLATNQITDVVLMGGSYETIERPNATVAGDALWIAGHEGSSVRLDLTSRQLTSEVPADGSKPLLTGGLLYASARETRSLLVVDPVTGQVIENFAVGLGPATPIAAGGSIWVPNEGDGTVTRIDPISRQVLGTIVIGGEMNGLIASEGAVWVLADNVITRIEIP